MEVKDVKENLGKHVLYQHLMHDNLTEYSLNAYIFRVDPKDPKNRLKQAELLDLSSPHSVVIVPLKNVIKLN